MIEFLKDVSWLDYRKFREQCMFRCGWSLQQFKDRRNGRTRLTLAEKGMSAADIADIVKVSVKLVQEWLSGNMSLAK